MIAIEYSPLVSTFFTQILSSLFVSLSVVVPITLPLFVYRIVTFTIAEVLMTKDFMMLSHTIVAGVSVSLDSAVIK